MYDSRCNNHVHTLLQFFLNDTRQLQLILFQRIRSPVTNFIRVQPRHRVYYLKIIILLLQTSQHYNVLIIYVLLHRIYNLLRDRSCRNYPYTYASWSGRGSGPFAAVRVAQISSLYFWYIIVMLWCVCIIYKTDYL